MRGPVAGSPGSRAPGGNASGSGTASPSGRSTGIRVRGGQAGADACCGVAGLHGGSGPFDLGRPTGCPPSANSGFNRLNPKPVVVAKPGKGKKGKKGGKKDKAKANGRKKTTSGKKTK